MTNKLLTSADAQRVFSSALLNNWFAQKSQLRGEARKTCPPFPLTDKELNTKPRAVLDHSYCTTANPQVEFNQQYGIC